MVSGGGWAADGARTVDVLAVLRIESAAANRRFRTHGLKDRADTVVPASTGLRQKMNIVRGFLTDPQVIFLDEPTLGLDVNAARARRAPGRWIGRAKPPSC
jgi:ABC-2 type transport system ATP-binding protein